VVNQGEGDTSDPRHPFYQRCRRRRAEVLAVRGRFSRRPEPVQTAKGEPSDPAHLPIRRRAGPLDDRPSGGKAANPTDRAGVVNSRKRPAGPDNTLDRQHALAKVPRLSSLRRARPKTFARVRT